MNRDWAEQWVGCFEQDFLGVPAKGVETRTSGVSVLRFKDGKIASQRDFWDAAAALRQLGAIE